MAASPQSHQKSDPLKLKEDLLLKATEILYAYGHPNIRAVHKTTLEITKDTLVTQRGDCIIAIKASKSLADLSPKFKEIAKKSGSRISITIEAGKLREIVTGHGSPELPLTHPTDIVVRKSDFICERTLMIHSNKAACDLSPSLIKALKNPNQKVKITLKAEI